MKRIILGIVAALALMASVASAQTTLNSTTISAAMTETQKFVLLTSATGVAANDILFVDREALKVISISSTRAEVIRGSNGTTAGPHASGAPIFTGVPAAFSRAEPPVGGSCTSTNEQYLPRVVVQSGNVYDCKGSRWRMFKQAGRIVNGGVGNAGSAYTSAGAISIEPGTVFIGSGGALAMTLANPPAWADGLEMCFVASTAQAHTVTYTAGFGGGTTARDVATFGGAIQDGMCVVAWSSVWWVIPTTRNVTIA